MDIFVFIAVIIFTCYFSVALHEYTHFYFARKYEIEIHEFQIGVGPTLLKFIKDGVLFKLELFPFFGYVKECPKSFHSKPIQQRIVIYLSAGILTATVGVILFFISTKVMPNIYLFVASFVFMVSILNLIPFPMSDGQQAIKAAYRHFKNKGVSVSA